MSAEEQQPANTAVGFKGFSLGKSNAKPKVINTVVKKEEEVEEGEKLTRLDKEAAPAPVEVLVIPLQETVQWRVQSKETNGDSSTEKDKADSGTVDEKLTEDGEAAKAILEDLGKNDDSEEQDTSSIPLLMRNRVPGREAVRNDEELLKLDITQRPDEATLDDYERVPIAAFGAALLRGMGWKEGEALGTGKFKGLAEPVEYVPKFGRGGLGAGPSQNIEPPKPKKYIKPGESREPKKEMVAAPGEDGRVRHVKKVGEALVERKTLEMERGTGCKIISGPHAGLYGRLYSVGIEDCEVKLAISGEVIKISQKRIELKEENEYKKRKNTFEDESDKNGRDTKRHKSEGHSSKSTSTSNSSRRSWLHSGIRVRVVSKSYEKGRHYGSKVVIDDVVSPTECICRNDSNRLLEGLTVDMLETVIPKTSDARVLVVRGSTAGQVGKIVDRDSKRSEAAVQLLLDGSVHKFSFDDICEYVRRDTDHLE